MTGLPAPRDWFGLVEASDWLVEGLGAIYRGADGRWWLTFQRAPHVRKVKLAHRSALTLLTRAKRDGLTVHTLPDPSIDGAETWIRRLGFEPEPEAYGGVTVWRTR